MERVTAWKPGKIEAEQDPPIQAVQGIMPDSKEEWRTAVALYRLKIDFEFQKPISGGRSVRGGQVVDFWIDTAPYPTPCFIQGKYWHTRKTENEDNLKQARVQRIYRGQVEPNLVLDAEEISSVDAAYRILRRRLIG